MIFLQVLDELSVMENAEKTTESMLLDENMEESDLTVPDSGNTNEVGSLYTSNSAINEAAVEIPDGELPEHLLETEQEASNLTEDITDDNPTESSVGFQQNNEAESSMASHQNNAEMTEDGGEETEADSVAFEQTEISSLEQGEEPMEEQMETHDEAISTTDDFMSETKALLVEGEPPHQLMEEADAPVNENDGEDMVGTSGIEESPDVPASAADEAMFADAEDKPQQSLQEQGEEGVPLEQEGEHVDQEVLDSLNSLSESQGTDFPPVPDETEKQMSPSNNENATELLDLPTEDTAADSGMDAGETMELPLPEGDTASGVAEGDSGCTILAGGDNIGGSLSDLDGKFILAPDGTVSILPGQLQGMQLMEGDDKPEEEANGEESAAQLQEKIRAQLHEALMKQEEIKQEQEDREPEMSSASQPSTESDALATLASAALDHRTPSNGVKNEVIFCWVGLIGAG